MAAKFLIILSVSPLFLSRDDNMICIKNGYRVCEMIPWVCGCSKYSTNTLGSPHLCSIFTYTVPFLSVISDRIIFYICTEAEFLDEIQTKVLRVGHGPVDKAPGCCKVALGSNPQPSTPKMGSSKVDEQPTGGPTKIRG